MKFSASTAAIALLLSCFPAAPAMADVTVQLGDQDFNDPQGVNGVAAFNPTAVGEPVPFDQFRGSNLEGATPVSESWTFTYPAGAYLGATFTLGITDHDSQAPGTQVASFTVDGHDLTALLNGQFESFGGRQFENNIYSFALPLSTLPSLLDGAATFSLTLRGPSLGGPPLTPTPEILPNNGAGLDFSRLTLTEVPEPGAMLLIFSAAMAATLRRRVPHP